MQEPLENVRNRLLARLVREGPRLRTIDDYFEGRQPVRFMSQILKAELGDRINEMIINMPRYAVEAYDSRLDIKGFRFSGANSTADELWSIFLQNDGQNFTQQLHQEALAIARSYVLVGPGDDPAVPLVTPESAFECMHENDPRTKEISTGVKTWIDLERVRRVSLYTSENRTTWVMNGGSWVPDSEESYDDDAQINRMVPMLNQARVLGRIRPGRPDERLGRSVFHDVIPIFDAINKMATDMMVSGEFHAMPRRWATGLDPDDFTDELGQALGTWELIAGRIWATSSEKAKMGQFQETDLAVFHNTIKLLIQIAVQLLGLPPHYLAFMAQNPPSSDAIRASEVQLVKRAERLHTTFGGRHARVQRLVLVEKYGSDDPSYRQIETDWFSAATPTIAQQSDASVKLVGADIIPKQQARIDLGYTPEVQKQMDLWDAQNATSSSVLAALAQRAVTAIVTAVDPAGEPTAPAVDPTAKPAKPVVPAVGA